VVHFVEADVAFVIASRGGRLLNVIESHCKDVINLELVAGTFRITVEVETIVVAKVLEGGHSSHFVIGRSSLHEQIIFRTILHRSIRLLGVFSHLSRI